MLKHESIMFNWQFVYKRGVLEMKDLDLESIWEREITVEDATEAWKERYSEEQKAKRFHFWNAECEAGYH